MSRTAVSVIAVAGVATAQLGISGVRCGQLRCTLLEYCSSDTDRCAPCSEVCNNTKHNYDEGLCVKECQAYIHDLKYPDIGNLLGGVQAQARASLIISCVALAVLIFILVMLCLRFFRDKLTLKYLRQKLQPSKNRVKQQPADLIHHNPHAEMAKPKTELKLDIRNQDPPRRTNPQPLNVRDLDNRTSHTERSQGATTPKTVSTTLSNNRHPAEDTTLDYSYDNRGLNVTPPARATTVSHNF